MNFEELHIRPDIIKALNEMNITEPTLIQQKAIPLAKEGKDVIGMSKTGSGKTAAFGIPMLEKIDPSGGVQAVVIAPTRELAVQISDEIQKFGKYMKGNIATVYGGVGMDNQIRAIARSQIIVATPGRLLDHMQRGNADLSKITLFVLDEADKLVDMGFIDDIRKILSQTPREKQMLLFGATLSTEIEHLKREYMHAPIIAEAEKHVKEDLLEQYYYNVKPHEKFSFLVHLLKKEPNKKSIIFCATRHTVDILAKNLRDQGIRAELLHGKLTQSKRLRIIDDFHKNRYTVLVASSVAARGLHISDVSHVFNYELSRDPQEYIHRIGRTARAGESGKAITLLSERDYDVFSDILRRYRVPVHKLEKGEFARLRFETQRSEPLRYGRRPMGGRRFGGRHSPRSGMRSHHSRSGISASNQHHSV
jgi:superfamily II DNA/RNA helicase